MAHIYPLKQPKTQRFIDISAFKLEAFKLYMFSTIFPPLTPFGNLSSSGLFFLAAPALVWYLWWWWVGVEVKVVVDVGGVGGLGPAGPCHGRFLQAL